MQDEGSALNSNDVKAHFDTLGIHLSNCCNHIWPNVLKACPGVKGTQTFCRRLSAARTDVYVKTVLKDASAVTIFIIISEQSTKKQFRN